VVKTLVEIQEAIEKLPAEDLAQVRRFLDELGAKEWDGKIEADSKSGLLDSVFDEADVDTGLLEQWDGKATRGAK